MLSLLTAWALCASPARAGVYTYGAVQRTVNAGVLINGGASGTAPDKDPYVFYVLSQRPDVRPFGWNLVNPLAPKSVTGEVKARWDALYSANKYAAGQPVQPNMAAYWEVSLPDASPSDLAQFDVLLLNLSQTEKLTAASAEKLRRFVDAGGVLWVEDSNGGSINNNATTGGPLFSPLGGNSLPANDLTFGGAGGTLSLPNPPYREPLLSTPYLLSEQEILALGAGQAASNSHTGGAGLLQSVLYAGGSPNNSLSAGQLGAGFVVASSTQCANAVNEYVGGTNIIGGNSGPYCGTNYAAAPAGDLKLLCNIIASAGEAPHERQNAHQQGGAANTLTAAALSWTYKLTAGATPPNVNQVTGAAINGQIAYVTDAGGTLHAFDINPIEDLDGDGNPDDGDIQTSDFSTGKPYDELWSASVGANASAPTVAYDPGTGAMAVFVEQNDGKVLEFDAAPKTGAATPRPALNTFTSPTANSVPSNPGAYSAVGTTPGVAAPAPTVYEGRLYAGQPNSSLFVQDLVTTTSKAAFVVNIDAGSNSGAEYVCASPSVGIQTETQRGADTNDILAYVTTNHGVYTVFCGARGEQLLPVGGAGTGLNTKLQAMKPTGMAYGRVLNNTALRLYSLSGGYPVTAAYTSLPAYPTPQDFAGTFSLTTTYFADYDVDFVKTAANANTDTGPLTRTGYSASSPTNTPTLNVTNSTASAAALDHFGNAYFNVTTAGAGPLGSAAVNSSLFCVHDSYTPTGSSIAWRFRLPAGADGGILDADGTNYGTLTDFHFVGAPVVDAQGFVYALASDGNNAAVLCLNGQGPVTLDVFDAGTAQPISSATYTQPIPAGDATKPNEFGDSPAPPVGPQQYMDRDTSGHLTLTNFGAISGMNGHELSPTLSEPQPVTVQYTPSSGPTGTAASTLTTTVAKLHTNLLWFTVTAAPNATGLVLVGNRLYFGDSNGNLYRVIADPAAEGITGKVIADTATSSDGTKMVSPVGSSGLAAVGGTLTAANGTLVVNGTDGVSCFADRTTLVVDANRVMEVDADGQATWVVDSTTRATTEGGNPQVLNTGTASTDTGQTVTTDLALSRPSSVTQLTRNDYLVADTGNNRVVRFDRSGHVIWELSKFTDTTNAAIGKTTPLMTAGEADTLNQPTSVQIFRETLYTAGVVSGYAVHYLVSDSGNYRVVEVTDIFGTDFKLTANGDHQLTWISRTADKQARNYRYQSASYFYSASGKRYVIALVTNTRIAVLPPRTAAPATFGTLAPANQDAPGGSVVLIDYDPAGVKTATQKDGYISSLITRYKAYLKANGRFDVTDSTGQTTLQVRNPRYLKPYTKPNGTVTEQRFLLADDNGVFDLNDSLVASWGFTQADYRAMQNPLVGTTGSAFRANLPFIPTCVQRLTATDALASGALVNHYLVTASYSQGESVHDPALAGLGGEAFETSVNTAGTFSTDATTGGGFGGHTLSRPGNTNPLEQPTFTYRLQ